MKEEGFVFVLVLVILTVIFTLATGLLMAVNNDIKMASAKKERIKSFYKAESGIEEAYNEISNDTSISKNDLKREVNKNSDDYNLTNVSVDNDSVVKTYKVTSQSSDKQIIIKIKASTIDKNTVSAGGNIDTEIYDGLFFDINTNIEGNTSENIDPSLIPNFHFNLDFYVTEDSDGNIEYKNESDGELVETAIADYYFCTQNDFENKFVSGFAEIGNWWELGSEVDLPPGEIIYYDGDLNLSSFFGRIKGGTKEEPAMVIVNGDLNYNSGINGMEDVIFLVKDDFKLRQSSITADNTFIYTANENENDEQGLNIGGAISDTSAFGNYNGTIISKGDAVIKILLGEGLFGPSVEYEKVNIRKLNDLLDEEDTSYIVPKIIFWEEKIK